MLTETITFYEVTERMPDSDLTVIVRLKNSDDQEPVWLGYHDGERWRDLDAMPIEVVRWADMPEGGAA